MGQLFYASVFLRSVAAATGLGVPIFNIKAPSNGSVRLREAVIGTTLGSTANSATSTIRFTRNATAYATEGGTRALTIENVMPWGRAAGATVRAGVTAAAAATEGGKLIYADSMIAPGATGARWSWDSWLDPRKSPWIDNGQQLAVLLHATDTTVVNASVIFEEMTRNT